MKTTKKTILFIVISLFILTQLWGQNQSKKADEKKSQNTLIQELKQGTTNNIRVNAAIALGDIKNQRSVTALIDTMDLEGSKQGELNNVLLRYIVRSLGRIGDRKAFLPLLHLSQKAISQGVQEEIDHAISLLRYKK